MRHAARILLAASVAALMAPVSGFAQTAKSVTLVSSTVNPPSISNIYYLAAMDSAFRKRGLDVQLQQSSGSPSSLAAIVSDECGLGDAACLVGGAGWAGSV